MYAVAVSVSVVVSVIGTPGHATVREPISLVHRSRPGVVAGTESRTPLSHGYEPWMETVSLARRAGCEIRTRLIPDYETGAIPRWLNRHIGFFGVFVRGDN